MARCLALLFVVLLGCGDGTTSDQGVAVVERVVDGDTVIVTAEGRREPIRLLGIDTPETVAADRPVECYGPEASARLEQLLPAGTPVVLVRDIEARDRYDRLLAYVYRAEDGVFVNHVMVAEGFAELLVIEPNVAHRADLSAAAAAARAADLGLWGAC